MTVTAQTPIFTPPPASDTKLPTGARISQIDADERELLCGKCAKSIELTEASEACVRSIIEQLCPGPAWVRVGELKGEFETCRNCYVSTPRLILALHDAGFAIARTADKEPHKYYAAIEERCWKPANNTMLSRYRRVCAPPDSCMEASRLNKSGYTTTPPTDHGHSA